MNNEEQQRNAGDDARDAARYRWLRENACGGWSDPVVCVFAHYDVGLSETTTLKGRRFDKAIDAAIAAKQRQGERT